MSACGLRPFVLAGLTTALFLCGAGAEEKKADDKKPPTLADQIVKIGIVRGFDRKGDESRASGVVEDKDKIAALLKFFPELGKKSENAGGWLPGYRLTLQRKKGDPIDVYVSWDLQWWSEANAMGDWTLSDPDKFEKLMNEALKK
jgi:hypothetical protein